VPISICDGAVTLEECWSYACTSMILHLNKLNLQICFWNLIKVQVYHAHYIRSTHEQNPTKIQKVMFIYLLN